MSSKSILREKSFAFALRIIKLSSFLVKDQREYVLSKQILRCGTAIGALVREAEHAESRNDFIHKLSIALKEANECEYWLGLLYASELITKNMYHSLIGDGSEILKMLISSIKTLKNKM